MWYTALLIEENYNILAAIRVEYTLDFTFMVEFVWGGTLMKQNITVHSDPVRL